MARSPFSGAETTRIWGRKDGRAIFECPDTGAVFFDRAEIRREDYQEYYPYLAAFDAERFAWELRIRRRKYERQLELMEAHAPGRRLLDIGAGPGYLVRVALDRGWDAKGVELAEEAKRHGRRVYGVTYVELDDIEDGSLDVVTCHHVLEHLMEPAAFLDRVHRALKPGGLAVFHVPHQRPLTFAVRDRLCQLAAGGRADTFCCLYGDIHITGFTERSLARLVERHGYSRIFTQSADMWSKFYDPFFFGNYVRDRAWGTLVRKAVRHAIENAGVPFGLGDWVIGYFRRI
jgi:SAM-dependent methyltransferase